jgi:hypothetical protein
VNHSVSLLLTGDGSGHRAAPGEGAVLDAVQGSVGGAGAGEDVAGVGPDGVGQTQRGVEVGVDLSHAVVDGPGSGEDRAGGAVDATGGAVDGAGAGVDRRGQPVDRPGEADDLVQLSLERLGTLEDGAGQLVRATELPSFSTAWVELLMPAPLVAITPALSLMCSACQAVRWRRMTAVAMTATTINNENVA